MIGPWMMTLLLAPTVRWPEKPPPAPVVSLTKASPSLPGFEVCP